MRIGEKIENKEYYKRPGAYAIIERDEDDKIAIVTNGIGYFFLGGGLEKNETNEQALKRELIEESGYTLKDVKFFDMVSTYIYNEEKGYMDIDATIYISKFDEKVAEPIEKDHKIIWVDPVEYKDKLYREYQRYILNEYVRNRAEKIKMTSTNKELRYTQVTNENIEIAYNIQKNEWKDNPDKQNFIDKANKAKDDYIAFIAYYKDIPIGITGVYTEKIDKDSIWLDWFCVVPEYRKNGFGEQILKDTINYAKELGKFLYFRVETTYWEGRPAVSLYDKVMNFKEEYTAENQTSDKQTLIYTYNFTDKSELWNNRYLGLNDYYEKCNEQGNEYETTKNRI